MKGSGTHKEPLGHEHLRDECTGPIGDRVPFFSLALARTHTLTLTLRRHIVTSRCLFRKPGTHIEHRERGTVCMQVCECECVPVCGTVASGRVWREWSGV